MKMSLISVTLDTSHSPIDPYAPLEQFHSREDFRQVEMTVLRSAFDRAENTNSSAREFGKMQMMRVNVLA